MGQVLNSDTKTFGFETQLAEFNPNHFYQCFSEQRTEEISFFTELMFLVKQSRSLDLDKLREFTLYNKNQLDKQIKKLPGGEFSALMIACINSNTTSTDATVKMLIDFGANLNLGDFNNITALMYACKYSRNLSTNDTVKLLINAGAKLDLRIKNNKRTALMLACEFSNDSSTEETVKLLIDAGCDLNLRDYADNTALMIACSLSTSSANTVKLLVDAGCDVNIKNMPNIHCVYGNTVLFKACFYCKRDDKEETIKILLDAGANVYRHNKIITLGFLCIYSSETIIRYFLDHKTYTEKQLLDCISENDKYKQLLQEYLIKLYYKKLSYKPIVLD